jgi:alkylhydroperoxidase family enzyme
MAWIKEVPIEDAGGLLKEQFDAAIRRAGRVYNIVRVMSQNPQALRDSMGLYLTLMYGASPLTRVQRELLAAVVSVELRCHY